MGLSSFLLLSYDTSENLNAETQGEAEKGRKEGRKERKRNQIFFAGRINQRLKMFSASDPDCLPRKQS